MTIKSQLDTFDAHEFTKELNWLFKKHGLIAGVSTDGKKVYILSSDDKIDLHKCG